MRKQVKLYRLLQNPEQMTKVFIEGDRVMPAIRCDEVGDIVKDYTFKIENDSIQTDFLYLHSGVLVYRKRISNYMSTLMEGLGEVVKLSTDDGTELFMANILESVNCLDIEESIFEGNLNNDELDNISKYVFKPERISPFALFKLYEVASKEIFALSNWAYDDFYKWYIKRNLSGLGFELLAEFEQHSSSHSVFLRYKD